MLVIKAYTALKRSEYILKNECIFSMSAATFNEMLDNCETITKHGENDDKKAFIDIICEKKREISNVPCFKSINRESHKNRKLLQKAL